MGTRVLAFFYEICLYGLMISFRQGLKNRNSVLNIVGKSWDQRFMSGFEHPGRTSLPKRLLSIPPSGHFLTHYNGVSPELLLTILALTHIQRSVL